MRCRMRRGQISPKDSLLIRPPEDALSYPNSRKLVLLVAEDLRQSRSLGSRLRAAGYRTQAADSLVSFWRLVNQELPFVILIFASPHSAFAQPWELCRDLAKNVLSLRAVLVPAKSPRMRIRAFQSRADQCFSLPGCAEEIIAFLDAVRWRYRDLDPYQGHGQVLTLDLSNRRIYHGGRSIGLTAHECTLLDALACREGQIVSHEELRQRLWKSQAPHVAELNLKQYIMRLRRKLEPDRRHPRYLQTVQGLGYRLQLSRAREPADALEAASPSRARLTKPSDRRRKSKTRSSDD